MTFVRLHAAGRRSSAILILDQLPDSRRAIVIALKREGRATIARLAEALGVSGEAVRQQMLQLTRDGWVEAAPDREAAARSGRPATLYRLTEAGDHLFAKAYDALSIALIDAVANELGGDAALRVLARVTDERVATVAPLLKGLTLAEKLEALRSWYLADDPHMQVERVGDDYRLVERNCPFLNTAMARPALCSVSVNALTRLLGVRVEREEKFQNGDGRCVFRAHSREHVDPDAWVFVLERVG